MTIILSLLVCLLGAITYLLTCNSDTPPPGKVQVKVNAMAFAAYWVGLLAFLLQFGGGQVLSIYGHGH